MLGLEHIKKFSTFDGKSVNAWSRINCVLQGFKDEESLVSNVLNEAPFENITVYTSRIFSFFVLFCCFFFFS